MGTMHTVVMFSDPAMACVAGRPVVFMRAPAGRGLPRPLLRVARTH
jgi:hypothetical protein